MRINLTTDHGPPDLSAFAGPASAHVVQVFCEHARLAQRLADTIGELRRARRAHEDTHPARDRMEAVLVEDLIPGVQAEDSALHAIAGTPQQGGARAQRRLRQQLHQHRQVGPELAVSLITLLRTPVGRAVTRPHPQLLRSGWPTWFAIQAQYRLDRWRDVTDSRATGC